ncbi:MAG: acyl-CoA dehydrogenase family protein [Aliidongia sp.]
MPAANLVGRENAGVAIVMGGLDLERAMISPILPRRRRARAGAQHRLRQDPHTVRPPIGDFQMIQSRLAEMYVAVETMRSFTYRVLAAANEDGGRRRRARRDPQADRGLGALCRRHDEPPARSRRPDPRRQRLYLGIRGQPAVPARPSCWRSAPARPKCAS